MIQLTKNSVSADIKLYFEEIVKLQASVNDFPVKLDDVWPLVYNRKDNAVKALVESGLFIQDTDYQFFRQKAENSGKGRSSGEYYLSIPCLEYLIARKKREVFEVYRQVFHRAISAPVMSDADAVLDVVKHIMDLPVDSRVKHDLIGRINGQTGQAAIGAPAVEPDAMYSATRLLKMHKARVGVDFLNDVLCSIGYMERVETKRGYYCVLIGEGLEYGENLPNPFWNGRRTMPLYWAGKFGKLMEIVDDCLDSLKNIYRNGNEA